MSDPSGFVWEAVIAARKRTGRRLTVAERAVGVPPVREFLIQEEPESMGLRRDLTGWLPMSKALVKLRSMK